MASSIRTALLVAVAVAPLGVRAQSYDIVWNGSENNDFNNPPNWTPEWNTVTFRRRLINNGDAVVYSVIGPVYEVGNISALVIGEGTTGSGSFTVTPSNRRDMQYDIPAIFQIGSSGGSGSFSVNATGAPNFRMGAMGPMGLPDAVGSTLINSVVGDGAGAKGEVSLTGVGATRFLRALDTPLAINGAFWNMAQAGFVVGGSGGEGSFSINNFVVSQRILPGIVDSVLAVGVGSGKGTMSLLSGGGFSPVVYDPSFLVADSKDLVGASGGQGELIVDGVNELGFASNLTHMHGVDIGNGVGSTGTVRVTAGGQYFSYSNINNQNAGARAAIGVDGGTGSVTVDGAGSAWYVGGDSYYGNTTRTISAQGSTLAMVDPARSAVSGGLHVGETGQGTLQISNGGSVRLGALEMGTINEVDSTYGNVSYYGMTQFDLGTSTASAKPLYLGTQASGSGTLIIGAAADQVPIAPGSLEGAAVVALGAGNSSVVFNHTGTDYTFVTPFSGQGTVAFRAGTTWLDYATAGQSTGYSPFSGTAALYAGTLGFRYGEALGSAVISVLGDAQLAFKPRPDVASLVVSNPVALQGGTALTLLASAGDAGVLAGAISGTGPVIKQGEGAVWLAGANTYSGVTQIVEGTLGLQGSGSLADSQKVIVTGSLDVSQASAQSAIRSLAGSGTVQTGTTGLRVTAADDTFAGSLLGTGAFDVQGGRQWLAGKSESYGGQASVTGGELWINGQLGARESRVVAVTGGVLGGSGVIGGDVAISSGGVFHPGSDSFVPGEITINGNLNFSPDAKVELLFGQADVVGGRFNDMVTVGGDLVLDGVLDVMLTPGGVLKHGVYRLMDYAGSLVNNGLDLGVLPPEIAGSVVQTAFLNQVNLVYQDPAGPSLIFWDGEEGVDRTGVISGGSGSWQSSAGNAHWTDVNATVDGPFTDGAFAIFGAAPGNVVVDDSLGAIRVAGMQFLSDGYVIDGDALELVDTRAYIRVGESGRPRPNVIEGQDEHWATVRSPLTGMGRLVKDDNGTLVLGGINTYTGGTEIDDGILEIASDAALGHASGDLQFVDGILRTTADMQSARSITTGVYAGWMPSQGTSLTLTGEMRGTGILHKKGLGTLYFNGDGSGFTGTVNVERGQLVVNGTLGGTVLEVRQAARLSGSGTVSGATTVHAGAVIAPGNSIGTLSVGSDYRQAAGATYMVELDPLSARSDRLAVSGNATLEPGAAVQVMRLGNGFYQPGTRYTILTAAQGLTGQFDLSGDVVDSYFLALRDAYDANNAYLDVVQVRELWDVACSDNGRAAAAGIARQPGSSDLRGALLHQPDAASACQLLGQAAGVSHASAIGMLAEDTRFIRQAIDNRTRVGDSESAFWAELYGSWGTFKGRRETRADQLKRDLGGLFVGADWNVGGASRVGVAAGYGDATLRITQWGDHLKRKDLHLAGYAATQWDNGWALHGGAAYGRHDLRSRRAIRTPLLQDDLHGKYRLTSEQVFAETSYLWNAGEVALQPFLNLAYVRVKNNGFAESGGDAALSARSQTHHVSLGTLGARLSREWPMANGGDLRLWGSAGWRRVFGDRSANMTLNHWQGGDFTVQGLPLAANAAALEVGVDVRPQERLSWGLLYSGLTGSHFNDNGAKAYVQWRF